MVYSNTALRCAQTWTDSDLYINRNTVNLHHKRTIKKPYIWEYFISSDILQPQFVSHETKVISNGDGTFHWEVDTLCSSIRLNNTYKMYFDLEFYEKRKRACAAIELSVAILIDALLCKRLKYTYKFIDVKYLSNDINCRILLSETLQYHISTTDRTTDGG